MIERVPIAGLNGSQVGRWIDQWRTLRDEEDWDVQLLTVSENHRGIYKVVALIGMGCKP